MDFKIAALLLVVAASPAGAHDLPLGDGHVTDHPAVGNVFSCRTEFRAGGARHDGPWFHGDKWDPDEKPHVAGNVLWTDAAFTLMLRGGASSSPRVGADRGYRAAADRPEHACILKATASS